MLSVRIELKIHEANKKPKKLTIYVRIKKLTYVKGVITVKKL